MSIKIEIDFSDMLTATEVKANKEKEREHFLNTLANQIASDFKRYISENKTTGYYNLAKEHYIIFPEANKIKDSLNEMFHPFGWHVNAHSGGTSVTRFIYGVWDGKEK